MNVSKETCEVLPCISIAYAWLALRVTYPEGTTDGGVRGHSEQGSGAPSLPTELGSADLSSTCSASPPLTSLEPPSLSQQSPDGKKRLELACS